METNVFERASILVEQFRDHHGGVEALRTDMRAALTGTCAAEIFGDQIETLLSAVDQMQGTDSRSVNATVHQFSAALLLKHQELLKAAKAEELKRAAA